MLIIPSPAADIKKRWGTLAHVEESERNRILSLPAGQAKMAIAQIEHRLKQMAKKRVY